MSSGPNRLFPPDTDPQSNKTALSPWGRILLYSHLVQQAEHGPPNCFGLHVSDLGVIMMSNTAEVTESFLV